MACPALAILLPPGNFMWQESLLCSPTYAELDWLRQMESLFLQSIFCPSDLSFTPTTFCDNSQFFSLLEMDQTDREKNPVGKGENEWKQTNKKYKQNISQNASERLKTGGMNLDFPRQITGQYSNSYSLSSVSHLDSIVNR